jgi:hypothetical protein
VNFLLDTNVVSELRKPAHRADPGVRAWAAAHAPTGLHLSAITILEIEIGIGRRRRHDPSQADRLQAWLDADVLEMFGSRILPVDVPVARRAARLHVPDPRPERDALIAATAAVHGMTVVTRNIGGFSELDVPLVDPFST